MPKQQYWGLEIGGQDRGFQFELRSELAWQLIHHFGAVAGVEGGEDSQGRAKLRLQAVDELVSRCFAIADAFVQLSEDRGEIKPIMKTEEEAFQRAGELNRIKSRAEYPINETPQPEISQEEREMRARHSKERAELRAKERAKDDAPKS